MSQAKIEAPDQLARSLSDLLEQEFEPAMFWGNQAVVTRAVRELAYCVGVPYLELSAACVMPDGVELVFDNVGRLPGWVVFYDYDDAPPETRFRIEGRLRRRRGRLSTRSAELDAAYVVASRAAAPGFRPPTDFQHWLVGRDGDARPLAQGSPAPERRP